LSNYSGQPAGVSPSSFSFILIKSTLLTGGVLKIRTISYATFDKENPYSHRCGREEEVVMVEQKEKKITSVL